MVYQANKLESLNRKKEIFLTPLIQIVIGSAQKALILERIITILNKVDLLNEQEKDNLNVTLSAVEKSSFIQLSAKNKIGLDLLTHELTNLVNIGVLINNRHFEALTNALSSIK